MAFDALDAGEIDVYIDYTGTLWANEMGRGDVRADRAATLRGVREFLEDEHGITLAATLGFENTYALAVRAADAERLDLRAISDLVPHAPRFAIGADVEFFARPEWPAVRDTYGLDFREQRAMDASLMYQAAATQCQSPIKAAPSASTRQPRGASSPPPGPASVASGRTASQGSQFSQGLNRLGPCAPGHGRRRPGQSAPEHPPSRRPAARPERRPPIR